MPRRNRVGILGKLLGADSRMGMRKAILGYLFISPWLLGLIVFVGGPMIMSLYLSLTEYDILSAPKFVGASNYLYAITEDRLFWSSLRRTAYYSVVTVPLFLAASLGLAMLLNQRLKATSVFRTFFFLPHLTPDVAMAVLWVWLLNPTLGPINTLILRPLGFGDFPWLTNEHTVIPSLILINVWKGAGSNRMLIFLAGLQGVPQSLLDAAEIDGAGAWDRFVHITLPMISPTILLNLVMGVINALQVFTTAFVATSGGPSYGSWFFALHIYRQAFEYFRMGYGSALAWVFLVIILILTLINFQLSKRWVYYEGEAA